MNTPVGLNFLIAGYAFSSGEVVTDPALPLTDARFDVHGGVLAYVRSLNVWGNSGKFDVAIPYLSASGTALFRGEPVARDVSGFGDPRLRFSVNFYGAPALSMEEFASYQQDLIVGFSLGVSLPLGQYDSDKLVNIGTNRWSIKPELGLSKRLGPVSLELAAGVTLFTRNDDFLGQPRDQAPLFSVQGNAVYDIGRGVWGAVTVTYLDGGRTTVGGVERDDRRENVRVGGTVTLPVTPHQSVKLFGSTGVLTRRGGDFNAVGVAWQYRWGAGL
ncbi:MAG TPA: transporter [Candidatus Acidoferrum sp.]|nr:transporter [Candidatus Acidoferrum sp.]